MERFSTTRGKVKEVTASGGLAELAKKYFNDVESTGENAFRGSHGIMKSIEAHYDGDALIVEVDNQKPDFSNPDAMKEASSALPSDRFSAECGRSATSHAHAHDAPWLSG